MQHMSITEAATHLPQLIEAALKGEKVFLTQENEPLVLLMPVVAGHCHRQPGSAKGLITLHRDFDAQLDDFREYYE